VPGKERYRQLSKRDKESIAKPLANLRIVYLKYRTQMCTLMLIQRMKVIFVTIHIHNIENWNMPLSDSDRMRTKCHFNVSGN
jgi:hypothetical protein